MVDVTKRVNKSVSKGCYVCLFKRGREEMGMHTALCTLEGQRTEKLTESGLCFHKALLDQTQAVGFGTTCLSLLSNLTGPKTPFSEQKHWVSGALFYT